MKIVVSLLNNTHSSLGVDKLAKRDYISATADALDTTLKKSEELGHDFIDAVKAKYFTRTATAKNGGHVEMTFDSETKKLTSWTRQNPDGTLTKAKINNDMLPIARQSFIVDGDEMVSRTKVSIGGVNEIHTDIIDLSKYPAVLINEKQDLYTKGKPNPLEILDNMRKENLAYLQLSKEEYIEFLQS